MKNCGDMVHMHVAEKGVIHEMVRIAKKKVRGSSKLVFSEKVNYIYLSLIQGIY